MKKSLFLKGVDGMNWGGFWCIKGKMSEIKDVELKELRMCLILGIFEYIIFIKGVFKHLKNFNSQISTILRLIENHS